MRYIRPGRPNHYAGGALDRAAHLRDDEDWVARALQDPASRFTLFWRGKGLVTGYEAPRAILLPSPGFEAPFVFLGVTEQSPLFALDISHMDVPPGFEGGDFADLRALAELTPDLDATILATTRGMMHWRATHRFCPACGGPAAARRGGWVLVCTQCGRENFPRTDAAVIMLVMRGERVLLGQSHRFPPERNMYSTLAGFVEPGESLEDAVRREVREEVGVRVGDVAYHSSQPWPFPASLMLGFYAEALNEEIVLEDAEMRDAKWFTREDVLNCKMLGFSVPSQDSIARRLIDDWLHG